MPSDLEGFHSHPAENLCLSANGDGPHCCLHGCFYLSFSSLNQDGHLANNSLPTRNIVTRGQHMATSRLVANVILNNLHQGSEHIPIRIDSNWSPFTLKKKKKRLCSPTVIFTYLLLQSTEFECSSSNMEESESAKVRE